MKQISEAFSRRLKDTGVTRIQWIALYYISMHQPISQRHLSNLMGVKDSSATRLIERMERDGYVVKTLSEKDKRVSLVNLTEKGTIEFSHLLSYGDDFNNALIENIEESDLLIYKKVLAKMIENINHE